MSSGMIIAAEMTLVLGGVFGLAIWELLRLRKDRAGASVAPDATRPAGTSAVHDES